MTDPVTPNAADTAGTTERTIVLGDERGRGALGPYRRLAYGPGEPHRRREELATATTAASTTSNGRRRSLLHLAHLTDLQLADAGSPTRMEFLHDHAGEAGFEELVPMFRPQELLGVHATAATIAAIEVAPPSVVTGAPIELVITTGDNVDNAQHDELATYLAVLAGGTVDQRSGGEVHHGPQDGTDARYWNPDLPTDRYAEQWGFPRVPGLVAAALRPFEAPGFGLPWLTAFGNHDGLLQGRAAFDATTAAHTVGTRKPTDLPDGPLGDVVDDPMALLCGPDRPVPADAGRRPFARAEYTAAHRDAGGAPHGHGFGPGHDDDGPAAYVHDLDEVRIVTLDTTNPGGYQHGSIGPRQLAWLEERLREVHTRHLAADGCSVAGPAERDRIVVLCSHHGVDTLTNPYDRPGPGERDPDLPRLLADDLLAVLHRFPNVVVWLSGHVHRHRVRPHPGPTGGFWEITTASVMEWPCQSRSVELIEDGDGTLTIRSTVLDHAAPLRPASLDGIDALASWHRELAANDPTSVAGAAAVGEVGDRNVDLVVPDPRWRGVPPGADDR